MWYGGGVTGLISTGLFMLLAKARRDEAVVVEAENSQ
jgi:hypothetical protein